MNNLMGNDMTIQQHAITQRQTGRLGLSCRFAFGASAHGELKPMNLTIACNPQSRLPYGHGRENDSRQSGRMTL
jgi:hypothetical protein